MKVTPASSAAFSAARAVGFADVAPGAADLPGAEADIGGGEGGAPELAVSHLVLPHPTNVCAVA